MVILKQQHLLPWAIHEHVAIKQSVNDPASPPSSSSSGPTPDEQFVKEVSVTVDISGRAHHVVQCLGWSVLGEGQVALVMKLYKKSLYKLIEEQLDDALPLVLIVKIGLHVARGMLELHTERIVFEDLKPHNVLLDAEENAFLSDFGLSKQVKDLSGVYTSNVGGTYLFMAPEKLRPPNSDKIRIGFASDVWAFGITMLQLLCCDTMAPYGRGVALPNIIMMLMVDRQAPQVPAVPDAPELQHILQTCLSLDYKERPSAAQLVQAFERIFLHLQSTTPSPGPAAEVGAVAGHRLRQ
ncbi:kinase-like domain-containing protein [Dunaliella salina]|uniref:Kinase-like domain-containing protein n=1 Tax=Dunaliella salina TaxID=3046 RepID=A0ABQ7GCD8_DUNSA|nr:kinase-like domain-containing protein [Dunaliella salina]|eukprot:KAF5832265.1 kinase-like domain-containing protein [Dunaliella salina]